MTRNSWIILCLAYIVGLLSTNLFTFSSSGFTQPQFLIIALGLIGLAYINEIALRRLLRISSQFWIVAAIVAILAVVYFQLRIPQPTNNDISYQVSASESELVTVAGRVLTEPRLNDNQRLKFWLKATEIDNKEEVSGKLYVTVPLLQGTGINPVSLLKLETVTATWLILSEIKRDTGKIKQYIQQSHLNQKPVILVSSKIPTTWLELQPHIIISSANSQKIIPQNISNTKLYNLKRDGTITWTPQQGFKGGKKGSQSNYIF